MICLLSLITLSIPQEFCKKVGAETIEQSPFLTFHYLKGEKVFIKQKVETPMYLLDKCFPYYGNRHL
jgi:hypothetical protein